MLYPTTWKSYELIDIGEGRKLERFGELVVDRPEPAATGKKGSANLWDEATHRFIEQKGQKGNWNRAIPDFQIDYQIQQKNLRFQLKETAFKHLGIFPEQAENWEFIAEQCQRISTSTKQPRMLNLFAYTGGASLVADQFGAKVTHVDSSKTAVSWARENADINGIDSIRWIVEDARKYVERCIKRGETYHGIILDPPIFGMVPKGKNWKLNDDLEPLLSNILKILEKDHRFLILNTYSPQLPLSDLKQLLRGIRNWPKNFEATTLGLKTTTGKELELGNLIRFSSN
ncbi:MAG: class I SAM-dependent methyltransferase [bacterium]|nr:class I SAM-dependent methyltransferase [bacterium]